MTTKLLQEYTVKAAEFQGRFIITQSGLDLGLTQKSIVAIFYYQVDLTGRFIAHFPFNLYPPKKTSNKNQPNLSNPMKPMPRPPRIDIPGVTCHVIGRGVRRSDLDRQQFLRYLLKARQIYPFTLQQYCLMTNHYHLLLTTIQHSLAVTMRYINSMFARYFNASKTQVGHVFQGRYHSIPVEDDAYLLQVSRYIHLNPVRAGLVSSPEDFVWSNYRAVIEGKADTLTNPKIVLEAMNAPAGAARESYRRFVEDGIMRPDYVMGRSVPEKLLMKMRRWGPSPKITRQFSDLGLTQI